MEKTKFELIQNRLSNFYTVGVMNNKFKKPTQLYKFDWETETRKILTKVEFDNIVAQFGIPKVQHN